MQAWGPLRGCIHEPQFLADAAAIGITAEALDEIIRVDVEDVLCGATLEKLNEVYPVLAAPDLRLVFTNQRGSTPALRIAWRIATEDFGKVDLLRCAVRT